MATFFDRLSEDYSIILATTPAPTVRPPSRMAKRRPSSIAIGSDQGNGHLNIVARHNHFGASRQFNITSHVSGTEVELRTVAFEERSVTTAFILGQNVNFRFELGVRVYRTGNGQNLSALNFVTLGTTQQNTNILTSTAFVQQLAEHLNTGTSGLGGLFDTNDFDFVTNGNDTALYTTGNNSTTTGDGEYIFHRHQERLVNSTLRLGDVGVQSFNQLLDSSGAQLVVVFTFQSHSVQNRR